MTIVEGPRVTVRDIAADTGVSIATVSRVLNDHVNVAPRTRTLVLQAVERRKAAASALQVRSKTGSTGAIFVRCPYVLTDYFGIIVSSIAETLQLHGRQMLLNAGESAQRATVLKGLPDESTICAAIMILPPEESHELISLRARNFPFVVVDPRHPLSQDIAAVSAANFSGSRALSTHLIDFGHRRIGVIGGPADWVAGDARLAGHRAAMAEVGVLPAPDLLRFLEPTTANGYLAARQLLDRPDRPTAIMGFNDKVALGALRAAQELGLRVPQDLSITGFDDIDLSNATHPTLTTVRQPLQEMGRMAVTLLMRILDGHDLQTLHVTLATELIVRESTGPVAPTSVVDARSNS